MMIMVKFVSSRYKPSSFQDINFFFSSQFDNDDDYLDISYYYNEIELTKKQRKEKILFIQFIIEINSAWMSWEKNALH